MTKAKNVQPFVGFTIQPSIEQKVREFAIENDIPFATVLRTAIARGLLEMGLLETLDSLEPIRRGPARRGKFGE